MEARFAAEDDQLSILEETKGALPLWLSPVQVSIIPVNPELHNDYAEEIRDLLQQNNIRVELDSRNEKLGYRLREAQTRKIPYNLIIGDQEKENRTISFRLFGEKDTTTLPLEEFIEKLKEEIETKALRK